ncbi:uncharacterized protein [Paramisgurnus dabryanus]|uniref:uncharacterized protein n=1 Tax=Paramisgurnus dabryanus TaxID=90735 RepID=UPI0031F3F990
MAKSAGTKDSNELAHLLKTYVEKLEKLCHLCNIIPICGFPKRNKAMKRMAESLLKVHHEKRGSYSVSTIHKIIKSGTTLIEDTIEILEDDFDPVQPCSMSGPEPVINIHVFQSQELTEHYEELVSVFPGESEKDYILKILKEIIDKDTKDSNELARLLKTYVEKLKELCHLCNIYPKSGFPKRNKAMKRMAESLLKVHHEKSGSYSVSTIHKIITALIENTIKMLEEDLVPVQPCAMSVSELTKHYKELVSVFPGKSKKDNYILNLLKEIIDKASNTQCVEFPFDCKSCSKFKDSSKWELFEPSEISDEAQMMYRMNLESGCYECMRTGLRVECFGDVQLKYQTCDWDRVLHDPVMKDYSPCGPLMNVKVISGEMKAVYLPHFLCLGGSIDEDKVKVLHVKDSGVSLEKCELTRFHAKLLDNNFSLKGLLVRMGFPVNIHCQTLIYQTRKTHLTLHVYLIPNENTLKKAVNKKEGTNMLIDKPRPVHPLRMNTLFTHSPLKKSALHPEITPESLQLTYSKNFFEAFIESPKEDFSLQLMAQENNEVVWKVSIRKGDYKQIISTVDGHTSARLTGTESVSDILLECLEELESKEWDKFKWNLTKDSFQGKDKIPRSKLEDKEIWDIVTCMIEHYQVDGAVEVTLMVLKRMKQNHLAEQLQEKYTQFQQ